LTGALRVLYIAPVITTSSIILSSSKIQNRNILVPANPGLPGKVAITTKREILMTSWASF